MMATTADRISAISRLPLDTVVIMDVNFRPRPVIMMTPTMIPAQAEVTDTLMTPLAPLSSALVMLAQFSFFRSKISRITSRETMA